MKILIGCSYTGILREEFAKRGHDVTSCDYRDTLIPGKHHKGNIMDLYNEKFDLAILHPDCKFLAFSGEQWIIKEPGRMKKRINALAFLMRLHNNKNWKSVATENSFSPFIEKYFRVPDCTVQPWQFGDPFQKRTCFWLRDLPILLPTSIVSPGEFYRTPCGERIPKWYSNNKKDRDKTFPGMASAIAEQWG